MILTGALVNLITVVAGTLVGLVAGKFLNERIRAATMSVYEWNARVQITTWGNHSASERGNLHDYAHKEWNGILKDFYYMRWKTYFEALAAGLNGSLVPVLDWYAIEEPWTKVSDTYSAEPVGDCVEVAKKVYKEIF